MSHPLPCLAVRAALAFLFSGAVAAPLAALDFYSVGSGNLDGNYYKAASVMCGQVNGDNDLNLRCSAEATPGSLYNIAGLRNGELDVALVQSDWHSHAYNGTSLFAKHGPFSDMRSVMALYPETVTILAGPDSDIRSTADLFGKRLDIGEPASGRRATANDLLLSYGATRSDFAQLLELPTASAVAELCSGGIDATILVVGHPNQTVATAIRDCGARIVPLRSKYINQVLDQGAQFSRDTIPARTYPGLNRDIPTFSVTATLVTRADIPDAFIETLVTETLSNLGSFASQAAFLGALTPDEMESLGLTAPLHPGAIAGFEAARTAPKPTP
ncbi:TAXI family TRAP transporter solute-binding subunit [Pseudoruegeria sp. SK021]|uniref:TAXI family TRAP transporter solute-binding subunit n=1 Tax=Pseudoruegeria sp. SK021 TaxID=1933035 RepID=UPI000A218015|nr:TAXI family TRAP transporter solute-binding subunit [Pseudoruegeria sp. SK021]OSP54417.1 hypothetical protein BV911_12505 [Pseudoruegeria sp. SK021]